MIGGYIKQLRISAGLSQHKLMKLSGISNAEISRIETGERKNPSPIILKALAPHLGVRYEDLMKIAGYIEESSNHAGSYIERIFTKIDGKTIDIVSTAQQMFDIDSNWAYTAYKVSTELSKEEIAVMQALANLFLSKKKKK